MKTDGCTDIACERAAELESENDDSCEMRGTESQEEFVVVEEE